MDLTVTLVDVDGLNPAVHQVIYNYVVPRVLEHDGVLYALLSDEIAPGPGYELVYIRCGKPVVVI